MFERGIHLRATNVRARACALSTSVRMALLACAVSPGVAWAGQLDYTLYTGLEHSNNITLSTTDPVSQNVLIPGFNFSYTQQGATIQANVAGTLEYRDYLGNQFSNQTQTQLMGKVNWTMIPSRLDFSFEDSAGVAPVDSLAANAPNNQQQINVLSLGPTLHFQMADQLRGQVELRYINSYASRIDDFNSSRGVAAFRVYHDISPTDQVSLNVESQRVVFDNRTAIEAGLGDGIDPGNGVPVVTDNYTRNELFGRYVSNLSKFTIDAELGWTTLHFGQGSDQSSPLGRLTLTWAPTLRSTFDLGAVYQYSDAAQDALLPIGAPISNVGAISVGNTVVNSQAYLERVLEGSYTYHTERWSVSVAPTYSKLEYFNNPTFNQTGTGGLFNWSYRIRPTISVSTFLEIERLMYEDLDRTDKTYRYGLDLVDHLTPHFSCHATFTRQIRQSSALGQRYTENEIYFGVEYKR